MKVRGIPGQLFDLRRRSFVAIRTQRRIFPHVRLTLALALVVGCSSKSDKPPPAPPPPSVPADAPSSDAALDLTKPCLPPSLADANVAYLRVDGPRITACYGNGDDTPGSVTACLVFDETGAILGTRTWQDADAARLGERELPPPTVQVEITDDVMRDATASYDKTRAFVFDEHEREGHFHGVFYDLRTNKQVGDVDLALLHADTDAFTLPYHVREARWVGARVLVTDRVEVGTGYNAFLVSSTGDHVFVADEKSTITVLDDELIAVITQKTLELVDVTKLRKFATISTPGKTSPIGDQRIARFTDQLVVAFARPAGIFFLDRATGLTINNQDIPTCP